MDVRVSERWSLSLGSQAGTWLSAFLLLTLQGSLVGRTVARAVLAMWGFPLLSQSDGFQGVRVGGIPGDVLRGH